VIIFDCDLVKYEIIFTLMFQNAISNELHASLI